MSTTVRAVIVSVGNELLLGETVDTNAAWLGRRLAAMGIAVVRRFTVSDDWDEIQASVRAATEAADLVILSGGLGPTADDLTRDAVAALYGRELLVDEGLLARLRQRFRDHGYEELPAPNVRQAEVPAGAVVIPNSHGTAPGILLEEGAATIVLLPGVPRELRGMFDGELSGRLRERFGSRLEPIVHRVVNTTGIPESRLAELIEAVLEDMGPVSLAFLPDLRGVDLRMTVRGVSESEAEAWLDRIEARIAPVVESWRFHAESGDIVEAVSELLRRAGRTVAVAESCTGGLIAKRLTELAGSSDVVVGGIVAYADSVKVGQLGVPPEDIEREGAVSEAVARQMATGVADRLGAYAGIGVTGIAGPGGGTAEKPVGTVWIGISVDGVAHATLRRFGGDRHAIRERAAQEALALLYRRLHAIAPEV